MVFEKESVLHIVINKRFIGVSGEKSGFRVVLLLDYGHVLV